MARGPRGWDDEEGQGDALPWLEAVEDEDGGRRQDGGRTVTYVLIGVAVLALVIAAVGLFTGSGDTVNAPAGGNADVIAAPEGPYKEAPDTPGGMTVEGEGDSVYAAGAGIDPDGTIDLTALPETPAARAPAVEAGDAKIIELPPAAVPGRPAPKPVEVSKAPPANPPAPAKPVQAAAAPTAPVRPTPAPAAPAAPVASATGGGYGLQLGAFSTQAGAEAAWKTLSGRFGFLGSLGKSITAAPSGGKTLYRLRAMGTSKASAESLCARLKVAGEACSVVAP